MPHILHLVRHGSHAELGQVLSGRSDIGLSAAGEAEAAALVGAFADLPIASVHASPRRRAGQTAAPLAAARGLPVREAAALDEIDFGSFTGRSFAALETDPAWQQWNADRARAGCPGGETMAAMIARACAYLFALPEDAMPALCVTHCDVIRGVVAHLLGMPLDRIFQLACEPAAITTLAIEGDAVRLVALNRQARR